LERSDQAEFEGEAVDLEGVRKGTLLQNGLWPSRDWMH
jgi:hypothetical protein